MKRESPSSDLASPAVARRGELAWEQHGDFVRRLARHLVRDEHAAEDVAQEAQLAAWSASARVPLAPEEGRAWLARIVRNLSSNWRRSQKRRAAHERSSARCESFDPERARDRLALQQRMIAHVAELPEPYRSTIYLRFYERLGPQQIAQQQGVSVHTVKTRLQRAIQRLRAALDREAPSRDAWRALLALPLTRQAAPKAATGEAARHAASAAAGSAVLGGIAMSTKYVAAVAALAVLALALVLFDQPSRVDVDDTLDAPETAAELEADAPRTRESTEPNGPDARVAAAPQAKETSARRGDWQVSGRVTDAKGSPLVGAIVSAQVSPSKERAQTRTDADGRYELALFLPDGVSRWAPLAIHAQAAARNHRDEKKSLYEMRLEGSKEPRLTLDFRLERGASIRGRLLAAGSTAEQPRVPSRTQVAIVGEDGAKLASMRVDREGRFVFPLQGARRAWLVAGRGRFGVLVRGPLEVTAGEDLDLGDLVLESPSALRGRITTPDGRAVPGFPVHARLVGKALTSGIELASWHSQRSATTQMPPVVIGATRGSARSDQDGKFRFDGLAPGTYELLINSRDRDSKDGPFMKSVGRFPASGFAAITHPIYRVHIRAVDTDGNAVPNANVSVSREAHGSVIGLSHGLEASSSFDVELGEYLVSASVAGAKPAKVPLVVTAERFAYDVELVLDFKPVSGDIDLIVTDERGKRVRTYYASLWDREVKSLAPVMYDKTPDAEGVLRRIPIGSYRLRVRFTRDDKTSLASARPQRLGDHFPLQVDATVRAGERSEVHARTTRGGRLHLSIRSDRDDTSTPVALQVDDGRVGVKRLLYLNKASTGASLAVLRPHVGAEGYSDLIRPGIYTLRARSKGLRDFAEQVRIEAGQITPAKVELRTR